MCLQSTNESNYPFYLQSNDDYDSLPFIDYFAIVINDSEEDQQLRNLLEVDPRQGSLRKRTTIIM